MKDLEHKVRTIWNVCSRRTNAEVIWRCLSKCTRDVGRA